MRKPKNKINNTRKEIQRYFDPRKIKESTRESFLSPEGKYRIETVGYQLKRLDVNWTVAKVVIKNNISGEILFSFFSNFGHFFHEWIMKDNIQYLVCAEDLFGGQTIIDLDNGKLFTGY